MATFSLLVVGASLLCCFHLYQRSKHRSGAIHGNQSTGQSDIEQQDLTITIGDDMRLVSPQI